MAYTPADILFNFFFFVIMVAMGTSISIKAMRDRAKEPWGVAVAWINQFLILPFLAYLITEAIELDSVIAVGLKLQAMCPGGATSNVLCFVGMADVPLSIACTSFSTLSAVGMMPLWIWVYLPNEDSIDFGKTIVDIMVGLGIVLVGTGVGVYLVERMPKWADRVNTAAGPAMILLLLMALGGAFGGGTNPFAPDDAGMVWLAISAVPLFGLLSALAMGTALGLPKPQRLAAAWETSCQNNALCLALLFQIYEGDDRDLASAVPIIYSTGCAPFNFGLLVFAYYSGWSYADPNKTFCENIKIARKHMIEGTLPPRMSQMNVLAGVEDDSMDKDEEDKGAEMAGVGSGDPDQMQENTKEAKRMPGHAGPN